MKSKTNRILDEALSLPEATRAQLAGKLFESLDTREADSGWEKTWAAEIERRIKDIDSGNAKLIPWSQVRRDILRPRREPKRRKASR
jgi:putative addiction module component (TIGR02574 family)